MSKSNITSTIDPHVDPYGYLGIVRNLDGSIARVREIFPTSPACSDPGGNPILVLSKDIPINQANNTWARLYLPRRQRGQEFDYIPATKLPLIVYFHGGGFVLGSAASSKQHQFCCEISDAISAVIVSVDYRLAPEHRLPAAYDDGMEALHWIKTTAEEWLTRFADFSRCFLMGISAGGNLAYHGGLRAVDCVEDLMPIQIRGLILQQPFFGGAQRSPSEQRLIGDKVLPPCVTDVLWELALPVGVDRNHEYANPRVGVKSNFLEKLKSQGWKVLVTGCDGDPLIDRQIDFAKLLEENGVQVVGNFSEGGFHGVELFDESKANDLFNVLKGFCN